MLRLIKQLDMYLSVRSDHNVFIDESRPFLGQIKIQGSPAEEQMLNSGKKKNFESSVKKLYSE